MSAVTPSESVARRALACYPAARGAVPDALGNRGGFSGARIWRVETAAGPLCLRAWPEAGPSPRDLAFIHSLMDRARAVGLTFVPEVLRAEGGATRVAESGRLWDLTSWMPGRADFHEHPSGERLTAACAALARLHDVWAPPKPVCGPCPAVARRLERARQWSELVSSGWRPSFAPHDVGAVRHWAERAWAALSFRAGRVPETLAAWAGRWAPIQPCVGDVWHDHLLFEGDRLTGLIDYGGAKVDHVAVDLARLLGSLVGDPAAWEVGLRAYRGVRPLTPEEAELAAVLDRTGTVLAAANWLRWLYHERRAFEDSDAVARRLAALVTRMESWPETVEAVDNQSRPRRVAARRGYR